MLISLSNMLVQSSVNSYGATAMAGFGAYMKIYGFNILPVTRNGKKRAAYGDPPDFPLRVPYYMDTAGASYVLIH